VVTLNNASDYLPNELSDYRANDRVTPRNIISSLNHSRQRDEVPEILHRGISDLDAT